MPRALQATLETRIAELGRVLAGAQQETRVVTARHADPADQAASEYERQSLVYKAATARQRLKALTQALERMRQGSSGECAECGGDIELKRLEAPRWARYCVRCQEAREQNLTFGDSTSPPVLLALPHWFRFPESEPRQHTNAHQPDADSRRK